MEFAQASAPAPPLLPPFSSTPPLHFFTIHLAASAEAPHELRPAAAEGLHALPLRRLLFVALRKGVEVGIIVVIVRLMMSRRRHGAVSSHPSHSTGCCC